MSNKKIEVVLGEEVAEADIPAGVEVAKGEKPDFAAESDEVAGHQGQPGQERPVNACCWRCGFIQRVNSCWDFSPATSARPIFAAISCNRSVTEPT